MKHVLAFLLGFLMIRLYYFIFIIRKNMKYNKNKAPVEVKLLLSKYNLDMSKINYLNLMKTISLINALIIGVVSLIGSFINKANIELLISMGLLIPSILIAYRIFGNYLVKKGLSKNV